MKVLHITPTFYPNVGGVEVFVNELTKTQKRQGIEVRILCLDNNRNNKRFDNIDGIDVHRIGFLNLKYYKPTLISISELKWADILHVHCLGFPTDFIALTKFIHKKPCVLTSYGGIFHTNKFLFFKKFYFHCVEPLLLSKYNYIISVSKTDYNIFSKIIKSDKLGLIPLAVFLEEFQFYERSDNKPYFVYIGRISKNKNLLNLLKTFKIVLKYISSAKLAIIGGDFDGTINEIKKYIIQNNLEESTQITGFVTRRQLNEILKDFYYFVSASLFESFGIAVTEAMSTGLVPIVQDIPAHREQVEDGVNGFIVDFNNPEKAAQKILKVLQNIDYLTMSRKASSSAQRFDINKTCEEYIKLYNLAINNKGHE
jgi:alpha-1,3-mannosyltransferase